MTVHAMWQIVRGSGDKISLALLIIILVMSLIQITPIKINPWDWLLGGLGKKINGPIINKISDMEKKLDEHIAIDKKEKLEAKRKDILDFANECMRGRKHTQEQFAFMLKKCDEYETYIEENHLKNGEITCAINEIRRLNEKYLHCDGFLKPNDK